MNPESGHHSSDLRAWQRARLSELRAEEFARSAYEGRLTLLAYTFPTDDAGEAFDWIEFAILQSWHVIGRLRTVIVASHPFEKLSRFASRYPNDVTVQIEPTLRPGCVQSMSDDCIFRLATRFTTPEVLIVQDDGFPIRDTLADFLGRYDYIGAPIIANPRRRKFFYAVNLAVFNGGFSLRSRRFCHYVARFARFLSHIPILCRQIASGEDYFYCFIARLNLYAWLRFRFPSKAAAASFAHDTLGGHLPLGTTPAFGAHGHDTWEKLLHAHRV